MSNQLKTLFNDTLVGGLKRKAITRPSKWAETYRVMKGKLAPGQWRFDYFPWLRGMHDSTAQINIGQKAAQLGYTETLLNLVFYKIDIETTDCLYVLPTRTPDASDFSSSRFDAALDLSPHLEKLFSDVKNIGHKRAGSANLYIRGSRSRGGLKSVPVGFIAFDELDEMNQENVVLGSERISGHMEWQIWKVSTPTAPEHGISEEFNGSTQEHFTFRCPHCGKHIELLFPNNIVITGEDHTDVKIKDTHLICDKCGGILIHEDKSDWLKTGEWIPFGDPESLKRGFYINQLYSPTVHPSTIATEYFKAQIDKASEQEFFNSKLGVPHVPEGAQVTDQEIENAYGDYTKLITPPPNKIITMGVDQGKWLHYEIDAWTIEKFGPDLNMLATCQVLTEGKVIDFEELDNLMRQWQVLSCVIDAQPERRKAKEFATRFWGYVKMCFYGKSIQGKDITVDKDEAQHKITVDRTNWLDVALNRFRQGTIILPRNCSLEYITHVKNLVRRYEKDPSGNPIGRYISVGDDHFGHTRCYAEIALLFAAAIQTHENIRRFF